MMFKYKLIKKPNTKYKKYFYKVILREKGKYLAVMSYGKAVISFGIK